MQSTSFTLSPSLTLHKPRRPFISNRFDPTHFSLSASSSKPDESSSSSFHRRYWSVASSSSSSSSSSFKFRPSTSLPTPASSYSDATRFETRTTSVPESADEGSNALSKTLQLGSLFGLWYLFNIYNKQVLKVPKISGSLLAAILPLAMWFFLLYSLERCQLHWWLLHLCLLSMVWHRHLVTEASFNWAGFGSAMASNLTFQSRNVLSKKVMVNKEETMDNINLFSTITVMSFFLLAPVAIFMEGVKFTGTED
ncbi:hypothetical protein K1719_007227 [Acacia pycnantha]|nr:hypothetical protein K1719_007227 [Acacia pycnantha]